MRLFFSCFGAALGAALAAMGAAAPERGVLVADGPWEMEQASAPGKWMPAVVPGTALTTLVKNGVVPDPYWGLNNKLENGLIPDLGENREFYTVAYRTKFTVPKEWKGRRVWMRPEGINYRGRLFVNGRLAEVTAGMFQRNAVDITDLVEFGVENALLVKVDPVDFPGGPKKKKSWGAAGEWQNGGDGMIGRNVTMLMMAGWDFLFYDGIRDRNTGIWRPVTFFATGDVRLDFPYVRTILSDDLSEATLEMEVTACNSAKLPHYNVEADVTAEVEGTGIKFTKEIELFTGERRVVRFSAKLPRPKLWWPRNKGPQNFYRVRFSANGAGYDSWWENDKAGHVPPRRFADEVSCRFGVRSAHSDQSGPGGARQFYVNGRKVFVRGTNWIPEAMLKSNDARMEREIRLTAESGVNMVRLWAGGIAESDRFYELCDEYGLLVWQEFFLAADTRQPDDRALYLDGVEQTVKRIRSHPSVVHWVGANESSAIEGTEELVKRLTGTTSWMRQSECDGVHDGSPYLPVNPMGYYMDTASPRGSRIYGFSPEYGTCALPAADQCRKFMPEALLWPVDAESWKYREGGGFYGMAKFHDKLVNAYGKSATFDEYCRKSQAADAVAHRALWEAWNLAMNRATGILFWCNNLSIPQFNSHAWDYDLDQAASFFAQKSALGPLHAQYEYLSNRVSVVNDTFETRRLAVCAEVYDFDSHRIWERTVEVVATAESCVDAFSIPFPSLAAEHPALAKPHFVKLRLLDGGREADSTFYWRSSSEYKGQDTATGPCTGGFDSLSELPRTQLTLERTASGVVVRNAGEKIAFMVEVRALDQAGHRIVPTFYSDNFFSLLPGESRTVEVEACAQAPRLAAEAWNAPLRELRR